MVIKNLMPYFFILLFSLSIYNCSIAQSKSCVKNADGVLIYPDTNVSGNTKVVRLQVISDKIIRVTASPTATIPDRKSLIIVNNTFSKNFKVAQHSLNQ